MTKYRSFSSGLMAAMAAAIGNQGLPLPVDPNTVYGYHTRKSRNLHLSSNSLYFPHQGRRERRRRRLQMALGQLNKENRVSQ